VYADPDSLMVKLIKEKPRTKRGRLTGFDPGCVKTLRAESARKQKKRSCSLGESFTRGRHCARINIVPERPAKWFSHSQDPSRQKRFLRQPVYYGGDDRDREGRDRANFEVLGGCLRRCACGVSGTCRRCGGEEGTGADWKLRVAIAVGPAPSGIYALKDETSGKYRGVTIALSTALAQKLGVPLEFIVYRGSGEIQAAANSGVWDVSYMPVDDTRKKIVNFGSPYHLLQSTYLVAPSSSIKTVTEDDVPRLQSRFAQGDTYCSQRARRRSRTDAGGKGGCDRAQPYVARRHCRENFRLAHPRWRLPQFDHGGRGAERKAGGARLCDRLRRGGQGLGSGTPRLRRYRPQGRAGGAGGDEALIPCSPVRGREFKALKLTFCRPAASKFSGASQRSKTALRAGHSLSSMEK
jgi:hypothetical protein